MNNMSMIWAIFGLGIAWITTRIFEKQGSQIVNILLLAGLAGGIIYLKFVAGL